MMTPTIAELLAALPVDEQGPSVRPTDDRLKEIFEQLALRPVPVGSLHRLRTLGGLQARLALAYLAYYIRTWFHSPDQKQQQLIETNLRSALHTLETMGYLRGAVMKVGQTLAMLPQLVPDEFTDVLEKLHFEAPPMHYLEMRSRAEIVDVVEDWANFYWAPLRAADPFDYGNPDVVDRAMTLWKRAAAARTLRQQPMNVFLHRCNFELVALLYRLRSKVDCRRIYEEEMEATDW